ncbi:MAG: histidinol dehydrogenase [Propionibacteriaceae bacterium]|jgi:histidinol dehydrogenase|nr:histidinol dehydrogenase [Propionibacteriaceae bacterium]
MLRIIDLRGEADFAARLPRAEFDTAAALAAVVPICEQVKARGEAAIREYALRFDGVNPAQLRVPPEVIQKALDTLAPKLRAALETAIARRRETAQALETDVGYREVTLAPGATIGYRVLPVGRVGLYVPGGLAPLASSVLHNAIPALVAGVSSIALASPPQADYDGWPHPTILAACALLGIDEVYAVGGAQAIAMFGYGVPGLCAQVDMVAGPGNVYVVAAKRYLRGVVGIDSEAGPSEICVWADDTANPAWVAADLISQAEHDPLAASVLVTTSEALIAQVNAEIAAQLPQNPLSERLRKSLCGSQSAALLVADSEQALAVVNAYAAEHLEVQTANAAADALRVRNAGAVFVGSYSPVPLGDYSAGSTHVLPTSGTARFASGLVARSYLKTMHYIKYDAVGLGAIAEGIATFAASENLPGHQNAINLRNT